MDEALLSIMIVAGGSEPYLPILPNFSASWFVLLAAAAAVNPGQPGA